jgi:hypothetical protein
VPRYEHFWIPRCVHGHYLIFNHLQPPQIEVSHVLQGARDIETHPTPEWVRQELIAVDRGADAHRIRTYF